MGICPDCRRAVGVNPEEDADSPEILWCECPVLKAEPYPYDLDEEEDLNE